MITIETLAQKFDKIYDDKKIINYCNILSYMKIFIFILLTK